MEFHLAVHLYEHAPSPRVSDKFSAAVYLKVARQDWKLNIVRLKQVKTKDELVWAKR